MDKENNIDEKANRKSDVSLAVKIGQTLPISFEPEDVQMFKIKFPDLYMPLENIALRRIVASYQISKKE
jgi:hypothetical protein